MPTHKAGGSLAISAGDTDYTEMLGGMVILSSSNHTLSPMIGENRLIIEGELFEKVFHGLTIVFK